MSAIIEEEKIAASSEPSKAPAGVPSGPAQAPSHAPEETKGQSASTEPAQTPSNAPAAEKPLAAKDVLDEILGEPQPAPQRQAPPTAEAKPSFAPADGRLQVLQDDPYL